MNNYDILFLFVCIFVLFFFLVVLLMLCLNTPTPVPVIVPISKVTRIRSMLTGKFLRVLNGIVLADGLIGDPTTVWIEQFQSYFGTPYGFVNNALRLKMGTEKAGRLPGDKILCNQNTNTCIDEACSFFSFVYAPNSTFLLSDGGGLLFVTANENGDCTFEPTLLDPLSSRTAQTFTFYEII